VTRRVPIWKPRAQHCRHKQKFCPYPPGGALLLFVDGLIQGGTAAERALEFVNAHCGVRQRAVCRLMKNILLDTTGPEDPRYENEGPPNWK
jgi:hypothetical protein